MTILVLGSSGQLASHLKDLMPDAVYRGRTSLDLADLDRIPSALETLAPSLIVNAAGYTAVDKAETERDLAWRVNTAAVAIVARTAAVLDVPVLHVSTDYVFDGLKSSPYRVGDPFYPLNVYGKTKLAGELALRTLWHKHWIIRTSWVFSEYGVNFVRSILRLASTRDTLRVVADQYGRPTYAGDLASLIVSLLSTEDPHNNLAYGTYHAVGGRTVSWREFAEAIVNVADEMGLLARLPPVHAIPTREYPTPAARPLNSVLEPSPEVQILLGGAIDWESALRVVVERIDRDTNRPGTVKP